MRPTDEEIRNAYEATGSQRKAAKKLGVAQSTFSRYWREINDAEDGEVLSAPAVMDEIPNGDLTVDEILEHKKKIYNRKNQYENAVKMVNVYLPDDQPIGISFFGDPHIDDDGCNIALLEKHMALCEQDGMYGVNIGDVTNNWVGRLEKLHNKQSITLSQTYKLTEWFMGKDIWLAHVLGNHDHWNNGKYLLKSLMKKGGSKVQGGTKILEDDVKLNMVFPNGNNASVYARHNFKGHSQWNPAHAVAKAAKFGNNFDVLVNGHTHVSGYQVVKSPLGKISHCVQLSAYKKFDSFAKEKGFDDQDMFENVVVVINPEFEDVRKCQVFYDPEAGAAYLEFLRKKNDITNKLTNKPNMKKKNGLNP